MNSLFLKRFIPWIKNNNRLIKIGIVLFLAGIGLWFCNASYLFGSNEITIIIWLFFIMPLLFSSALLILIGWITREQK
jgi:hypothetical protein